MWARATAFPTRAWWTRCAWSPRTEGVLLDPVYSGKGMAGLIDLIRKGFFPKDSNVVFLHTGGQVGLFGYPERLRAACRSGLKSGLDCG